MDIKTLFRSVLIAFISIFGTAHANEQEKVEQFKAAYESYQQLINVNYPTEALPHAKEAYELGQDIYDTHSVENAALSYNLGLNLLKVRRHKAALNIFKETIDLYEAVYGEDSYELIPVLTDTGKASYGDYDKAKDYYFKRALKISEAYYGAGSIEYADHNVDIGAFLLTKYKRKLARKRLNTGYKILVGKLGKLSPRTGFAAVNMGKHELSVRRYKAAIRYFDEAIAAFEHDNNNYESLILSTRGFLVTAYEMSGDRDKATEHCLAIGEATPFTDTRSYQPLVKIAPQYPYLAAQSRKEGMVTVEYDVDEQGFVVNPKVIQVVGSSAFIEISLKTAKKFRYAPAFENGKPVLTAGVRNRFTYTMSKR